GGELPIIAETHFALSRLSDPAVTRMEDCFYFGKSTKNQRIESWWQELEMSQLFRWRVSDADTILWHTAFSHNILIPFLFSNSLCRNSHFGVRTTNLWLTSRTISLN